MKNIISLCMAILFAFASFAQTTWGCMDPAANNYNPLATGDNGTCCYEGVYYSITASEPCYVSFYNDQLGYLAAFDYPAQEGVCIPAVCTSVNIQNYQGLGVFSWSLSDGQGNVVAQGENMDNFYDFAIISYAGDVNGCLDPQACNYNPLATCYDFYMCSYDCYGCTDPTAVNYDSTATLNDGTCCDASHLLTGTITGAVDSISATWYLTSLDGSFSYGSLNGTSLCVPDGCYFLSYYSPFMEAEVQFTLVDYTGQSVFSDVLTASGTLFTLGNGIPGCGDSAACNYDANATCTAYTLCSYDCYGCTNPQAANYDSTAVFDDGSCCTQNYTITGSAEFQYSIYNQNTNYVTGGVFPGATGFCLPDGCFYLDLWSPTSESFSYSMTDANGQVMASGSNSYYYASQSFANNASVGCLDFAACNYDPNATCNDYTVCTYDCYGCTDPTASNFDPAALLNNNSCCYSTYFEVQLSAPGNWYAYTTDGMSGGSGHYPESTGFCFDEGCLNFTAYPDGFNEPNFSASILLDGVVVTSGNLNEMTGGIVLGLSNNEIIGCSDTYACNYDPLVNCGDYNLCDYTCFGCTNPIAPNYNPSATIDNATCCYNDWYTITLSAPAYWAVTSLTDYSYSSGTYPQQNGFCMIGSCFQLSAWTMDGSDVDYTISDASGNVVSEGSIHFYDYAITVSLNGSALGCADPSACNYDFNASCFDYFTCDYGCLGCIDPTAPNYNASATVNDGSCCYNNWYSISASEEIYWYISDGNMGYFGGIYPAQSGFCSMSDCFTMQLYSLSGNAVDISITNAAGEVVYSGSTNPSDFYGLVSVSSFDVIGGCMDPSSCNYNAEATCDNGSCYICYGCTNPSALNYDAWAWFDDGTCIYEVAPPFVGMSMIPDEANNQFWVRADMVDQGNGAPYILRSNLDNVIVMMNEAGQYLAGPYPCDETVSFTLESLAAGLEVYMNASMQGACSVAQSTAEVSMTSTISVYPNPANTFITINGLESNSRIRITDMSGRMVKETTLNGKTLEISELSNGVYQLSAIGNNALQTAAFVIQH